MMFVPATDSTSMTTDLPTPQLAIKVASKDHSCPRSWVLAIAGIVNALSLTNLPVGFVRLPYIAEHHHTIQRLWHSC